MDYYKSNDHPYICLLVTCSEFLRPPVDSGKQRRARPLARSPATKREAPGPPPGPRSDSSNDCHYLQLATIFKVYPFPLVLYPTLPEGGGGNSGDDDDDVPNEVNDCLFATLNSVFKVSLFPPVMYPVRGGDDSSNGNSSSSI